MELAIPTGKFLKEPGGDTTLIEVLLDGKSVYAAVCLPFGWYFVPSAEWLTKWAREVVCWVAYEHDNPAHPIVVGYRPLSSKTPGANYPRTAVFKTERFRLEADDVEKTARIGLSEGMGLLLEEGRLTLSNGTDTVEPALLGDATVDVLEDLYDRFTSVLNMVTQLAGGLTALGLPVGATVAAAVAVLQPELLAAKQVVAAQVKSQKVKLA